MWKNSKGNSLAVAVIPYVKNTYGLDIVSNLKRVIKVSKEQLEELDQISWLKCTVDMRPFDMLFELKVFFPNISDLSCDQNLQLKNMCAHENFEYESLDAVIQVAEDRIYDEEAIASWLPLNNMAYCMLMKSLKEHTVERYAEPYRQLEFKNVNWYKFDKTDRLHFIQEIPDKSQRFNLVCLGAKEYRVLKRAQERYGDSEWIKRQRLDYESNSDSE